jgi:monoterpene epsilon-lactone hydrolase
MTKYAYDPDFLPHLPTIPTVGDYSTAEKIQAMRAMRADAMQLPAPNPKVRREDRTVPAQGGQPAVPLRIYTPKAAATAPRACVYEIHGGGFMFGNLDMMDPWCDGIAAALDAVVVSVDYRLAPEHPFPAGIDDACAAHRWLLAQGIPAAGIAIAGDSAGGGLTLATLVALRAAGDPLPAAAVCLSPLADLEQTGASSQGGIDDPMVSRVGTEVMAQAYLQGHDRRDPRASPIHADYHGFPPLLIQVGTREILLDDAKRVAERARAAGVPVELELGEGLTHVWPLHPHLPESATAVASIARFVRARLGIPRG